MGGDFNKYNTSSIQQLIPELEKKVTGPTREDHMSVSYEAILTRSAAFVWETSEYLKVTMEGSTKFKEPISRETRSGIEQLKPA